MKSAEKLYGEHRESTGKKESEQKNLEAARELLAEAERSYKVAGARYAEVLEEGKARQEEYILEAHAEYERLLSRQVYNAWLEGRDEEVKDLSLKIEELRKTYDSARSSSSESSPSEIEKILDERGITGNVRTHFLNRAAYLETQKGFPREQVLAVIHREIEKPPPSVIFPPGDWLRKLHRRPGERRH